MERQVKRGRQGVGPEGAQLRALTALAGFLPHHLVQQPYSFRGVLPPSRLLIGTYLRPPVLWWLLGKRFLVLGRRLRQCAGCGSVRLLEGTATDRTRLAPGEHPATDHCNERHTDQDE